MEKIYIRESFEDYQGFLTKIISPDRVQNSLQKLKVLTYKHWAGNSVCQLSNGEADKPARVPC